MPPESPSPATIVRQAHRLPRLATSREGDWKSTSWQAKRLPYSLFTLWELAFHLDKLLRFFRDCSLRKQQLHYSLLSFSCSPALDFAKSPGGQSTARRRLSLGQHGRGTPCSCELRYQRWPVQRSSWYRLASKYHRRRLLHRCPRRRTF